MVAADADLAAAREIAAAVPDPELPMLTLADLGILRGVSAEGGHLVVTITPTYSGCPALREIAHDLRRRLARAGFDDVTVRTELAPAWSSDWITAQGRGKLRAAGIAPPHPAPPGPVPLTLSTNPSSGRAPVACPRCGSAGTTRAAAFGATACKALYRCEACHEPFEYIKEI
jgi:ring-1,2-phenylacetyl-CoA epoxidase subunit PaaD